MAPQLIDTHSHIYPRSYLDLLKARTSIPRVAEHEGTEYFVIFPQEEAAGPGGGRPIDASYSSLDEKIAFMDRENIATTVISVGNPWLDPFDGPDSPDLARMLNAELAAYGTTTGGRILAMGVLPSNDIAAAVAVAGEVASTDGLYGLITGPFICGRTLDDPALDPLWALLESTALPLFVHPHYSAAVEDLRDFGHALPVSIGFPFETTIAISRLVFAGVLHRYPGLRLLVSHGGGALPMLAGRMDSAWRSDPSTHDRLPTPPSESLGRLYVDLVLYHERSMTASTDLVGVDRVVYGTDNPFSVSDPAANARAMAVAYDASALEQVSHLNARRLFGIG